MFPRNALRLIVLTAVATLSLGGGCVVEITPDGDGNGGGSNNDVLRVRIVNASRVTLDPQIFISAASVGAEGLFVDTNRFFGFGVGTLGLLGPDSSDSFEVECASAATIGTLGGAFGDDLNDPDGGGQEVLLQLGQSVFCEGELILTFTGSGTTFNTNFSVSR